MPSGRADTRFRLASALGVVGLILWGALWLKTFDDGALPMGHRMWLTVPGLAADFWSQSAYAAHLRFKGIDPYASEIHLLPYPPLVIRLFFWVHFFSIQNAIRVWFVAMAAVSVAAAVVAHRTRMKLGLSLPPLTISVLAVVASYPFLFQLERGNCDLITVFTILIALPLFSRGDRATDFVAGAMLSIGPWVKLYPGLMGLGLVALRRRWAVLGFVAGGAAIFLSMPAETKRSFDVLGKVMLLTRDWAEQNEYPIWSHSLSNAWIVIAQHVSKATGLRFVERIPALAVAGGAAVAAISPICIRVFRRGEVAAVLTYPLLLWICAVASCVPIIANDYSLVFYPLAVVACADIHDRWLARIGIVASLLFWQPFVIPISPWIVLSSKLLAIAGVGVSLWQRVAQIGPPASPFPSSHSRTAYALKARGREES
jgi:hypothetical protein